MDGTTDDLINLRQQILEQTIPLLSTDSIPADERFRLTLELARAKGTFDLYRQAYQIAQNMDADAKLGAYSELLAALDTKIQEKMDGEIPDNPSDQPENQPQETHNEGQ